MQLQTDCVCPVVCIFRPEQMLVYHVCCDVIASLFVSCVDPHSPSNVKRSEGKKVSREGKLEEEKKGTDIRVIQE